MITEENQVLKEEIMADTMREEENTKERAIMKVEEAMKIRESMDQTEKTMIDHTMKEVTPKTEEHTNKENQMSINLAADRESTNLQRVQILMATTDNQINTISEETVTTTTRDSPTREEESQRMKAMLKTRTFQTTREIQQHIQGKKYDGTVARSLFYIDI